MAYGKNQVTVINSLEYLTQDFGLERSEKPQKCVNREICTDL